MTSLRRDLVRRLSAMFGVLVMCFAFTLVSATAAQAANAPTCVKTSVKKGFVYHTVTVKNTCSSTKRVRVIWSKAPDDSCRTVGKGKSYTTKSAIGTFASLRSC